MIRRTPLQRSRKPIPRKKAKARRVSVFRDPAYLKFLRDECACVVCHDTRLRCDAAHGPVNGMGSKGPDNEAVPLCRRHHQEQHQIGWLPFLHLYQVNWIWEAAAHYERYLTCKEYPC